MCIDIYIYIYIHRYINIAHQKSTPRKPSWTVSGVFQWMFGVIVQRNFTCQWYVQKDCHFPSGIPLECSHEFPAAFSK